MVNDDVCKNGIWYMERFFINYTIKWKTKGIIINIIKSTTNFTKVIITLLLVLLGNWSLIFIYNHINLECLSTITTNSFLTQVNNQRKWYYLEKPIFIRQYSSNYPPFTRITLPALSPTMESGTILNWQKKEGDKLQEGDLLAEIETDKATMGFETPEEGYLAKILVQAGTKDVPIGKLIGIIVQNESDVAAFKDFKDDTSSSSSSPKSTSAPSSPPPSPPSSSSSSSEKPSIPSNLPKYSKISLPALSPTMEAGNILSWQKKEGDHLTEGDLLAEIETDKASMGFETPEEGYLAKILVPAGSKNVPVGKLIGIIVEKQADVDAFKNFKGESEAPTGAPAPSSSPSPPSPSVPAPSLPSPTPPFVSTPESKSGRVYVSPMAKTLAEKRNLRLAGKGTGLFGSITTSDLDKMPAAGAAPKAGKPDAKGKPQTTPQSSFIDIPLTNIRSTIAKRLLQSKQNIPHYYLTIEVNVDRLLNVRNYLNKSLEKDKIKISVNDFIIKAVALASRKVPEVNSAWKDTFIRQYNNVDVSVAVSTDKGLITPIVFNAESIGLVEISKTVKELALKARQNILQPQEYQGGTVTVSNLGMFGVNQFCAIINPPQSSILAIGTTTRRLMLDKDSKLGYKESQFLTVTLSTDHRVVDGAVGAQWLQALRTYLEEPSSMIL